MPDRNDLIAFCAISLGETFCLNTGSKHIKPRAKFRTSVESRIMVFLCCLATFFLPTVACGFVAPFRFSATGVVHSQPGGAALLAKGRGKKGFGSTSSSSGGAGRGFEKSYGEAARSPIKDLIDSEAAMAEFFSSNEEWSPLFRSIAKSSSVPAMSFLGGNHGEWDNIEFHAETSPWRQLKGIPEGDENRDVLATFLDAMQKFLVDIPVNEKTKDDEFDQHFIEEGRRMLVVSRFHVLRGNSGGTVEHHDELFQTCWSELAELSRANEENTGSIILLPDYDVTDLRRFIDMNLQRPLQWLGVEEHFEVASPMSWKETPAIRLIHKLSDMPTIN